MTQHARAPVRRPITGARRRAGLGGAATLAALVAACERPNPLYCLGEAHRADPMCQVDDAGAADDADADAPPDAPVGCATGTPACTGDTPACDEATGACVLCTDAHKEACTGATPACKDHACQPCAAHADCDSRACLPDGSCAAEGDVAYLSEGGTDNKDCTRALPCDRAESALKTRRPYVKVDGQIPAQNTVSISDQEVTILAEPMAALYGAVEGVLLEVKGTAKVSIFDLRLGPALGDRGVGAYLSQGSTATLVLRRVTVAGCGSVGVRAEAGVLDIDASTLHDNAGGGLQVGGTTVSVTNSFIVRNRGFGGLDLGPVGPGTSRIAFNTIMNNQRPLVFFASAGVTCPALAAGPPLADNLLARNRIANNPNLAGANAANCAPDVGDKNLIQNGLAGLGFVAADAPAGGAFDYHLTATASAARDHAVTAVMPEVRADVDGDPRPLGGRSDYGADEYRP